MAYKMKKIAIIGAGISGLSTAYHLHRDYQVTIFEKQDYFGGHTDTHTFFIDGKNVNIDSGFIIFCPEFYPNFSAMLDQLSVESQATNMSFSAHNQVTGTIYNATTLNKLFCQRRNIVSPRFLRMLFDIVRFYRLSPTALESGNTQTTVKEYLTQHRYGASFMQDHLFPMISALWSATPERVEQFPIQHLVEFFQKHGLMKLINRPQWRVIKNGSSSYIQALRDTLNCQWLKNSSVDTVERYSDHVLIRSQGQQHEFDAVVFATHSDQTLSIIDKPSVDERQILGAIQFEDNQVIVHTDESIMHQNKKSWASWNTEVPHIGDSTSTTVCTANYWMNSLQGLKLKTNVFTTLNTSHRIDPNKVLAQRNYSHPIFTAKSVSAQKQKAALDGKNRSYFVGAYWGWGFHEDGARSAVNVSEMIKAQV